MSAWIMRWVVGKRGFGIWRERSQMAGICKTGRKRVWWRHWPLTLYLRYFSWCVLESVDIFSTKFRMYKSVWKVLCSYNIDLSNLASCSVMRSSLIPYTHQIGARPCSRFFTCSPLEFKVGSQQNQSHTLWMEWTSNRGRRQPDPSSAVLWQPQTELA
jgi:hypothetical protein